MPEETVVFFVKAKAREELRRTSQNPREDFWNTVRQNTRLANAREWSDAQCEARLEKAFGAHLKSYLTNYFDESWRGSQRQIPVEEAAKGSAFEIERRLLSGIFFRASIEG